jgi:hypothetical protein
MPISCNLGFLLGCAILAIVVSPWWLVLIPLHILTEPWSISWRYGSGWNIHLKGAMN